MYCQFEQLKERNVHVKCFNQALYHVSSAKPESQNYCELHIQKLPRKTKLELLFDVIELSPSLNELDCIDSFPHNETGVKLASDIIQSSAGLVTSNNDSSFVSCSNNEHDILTIKNRHGEARACSSKKEFARPFRNLGELCECYGYLPRPKTWRMLPFAVPGEINGLHNTRGMALATNGIHVAIENNECKELFIGHLEWFIVDDLNAPAGALATMQNAAKDTLAVVKNQLKQFDDLFE